MTREEKERVAELIAEKRRRLAAISADQRTRAAQVSRCRTDFTSWCLEALRHQGFRPAQHHRMLISKLDQVAAGRTRRLMVLMPPGSAKSTYVSHLFPAWMYQQRQYLRIIGASHTSDLALDFSGKIQQLIVDNADVLTYGLRVANKERWYTTNGGAYLAAGVGSAIPGFRADLGLIDDPVKSRQAADSEIDRRRVWEWYIGSFERRLSPGAPIILILCMTGDTPVMLATGYEKPLRDIRPGDQVATYDGGRIQSATVRHWANQGPDEVFTIRMKSGTVVRANARHPFLVSENGREIWRRTGLIKEGDVILKVIGASGRGSDASLTGASSQQSVAGCARPTMAKPVGQLVSAIHPSILYRAARGICAIATGLTLRITTGCSRSREVLAPSAESNRQSTASKNTSALITTTVQERCEGCCATTVISWLEKVRQKQCCCELLSTCEITLDTVVEVIRCGTEEVFDIEVDRTSNFIANGLVSHNTRWHEDDLAGRLLETQGEQWDVLRLPAEAEEDDPLGRPIGGWLWDDDGYGFGASLPLIKSNLERAGSTREWASQYQQRPRPVDGSIFKVDMISRLPVAPVGEVVRAWDLAATRETGTRDPSWTRGVKLVKTAPLGRFVVLDVKSVRGPPDEVERVIVGTAHSDGRAVRIGLPQDPGQAGKAQVLYYARKLAGYVLETGPETGDKATRAGPVASQVNIGNVDVLEAPWNRSFLDELASFPSGAHEDQVDALSRAFTMLIDSHAAFIIPAVARDQMRTATRNRMGRVRV